jgi:predicted PurR-regulated permease PerM
MGNLRRRLARYNGRDFTCFNFMPNITPSPGSEPPARFLTDRQRQSVLWGAVGLGLLAALWALGPVLVPFVAAAILAYILEPLVDMLVARRVPRILAVILTLLLALVLMLAVVAIIVPIVIKESQAIRTHLPTLVLSINESLLPWIKRTLGIDLQWDGAALAQWLRTHLATSGDEIMAAVLGTLRSGGNVALQVIGLVFLVPIVVFYCLLDWHDLMRRFQRLIPARWQPLIHGFTSETDHLLGQYLRGQMLVMGSLAIYYCIALWLAGFELWLPIGLLTGLLIFVPYLGFGLIWVAAIYGAGQVLESIFLTPRLVGERIGLHPLAVILALLAFGSLFGFVGVLLALPLAAVLAVALRRLKHAYLASDFFSRADD